MVYAHCNNDDGCSKDQWWLKKPPSEYASGGPKCPECGTTRVSIGEDTAKAADTAPSESRENAERAEPANGGSTGGAPAKRAEDGQAGGQPPATQQQAMQAGVNAADMATGLVSDAPEKQAEAESQAFTAIGSMVASIGQKMATRKKEGAQRARAADDGAIEQVDDYPRCPSCDGQIKELPPAGTEFSCPHCGEALEA